MYVPLPQAAAPRPFSGKAPRVVASAKSSSFANAASFSAGAKRSMRGMRSVSRRTAVKPQAKVRGVRQCLGGWGRAKLPARVLPCRRCRGQGHLEL